MAMTLEALKATIGAAENGTLSLIPQALGIADVTTLFTTYLPGGALALGNSKQGADGLSAAGTLTVGQVSSPSAHVQFILDAPGKTVAGIVVTLPLPSWQITLPFTTLNATKLASRGVSHPRLVLRAGGADPANTAPVAQIAGDMQLTVGGSTYTTIVSADVPAAATPALKYQFTAQPPGVTLASPDALTGLLPGATFAIPADIPLAASLAVTRVAYVVDPTADLLTSLRIDLESAALLDVIPGVISIKTFRFGFLIFYPDSNISVSALAGTTVDVRGIDVDVVCYLPDLTFKGSLSHDTPVPLGPFLARFLPVDSLFDGLQISSLDFSFGLPAPRAYAFSLAIDGHMGVTLGPTRLELQQITIEMSGHGTSTPSVTFGGRFDIGAVVLYMSVSRSADGWTFTGTPQGGMLLGDIAASLLASSIHVPSALNPSFGGFSLAIAPKAGAFHFTAQSADPWTILDGVLSVDHFNLDAGGGSGPAGRITASLQTAITIAGLTIDITASLDQQGGVRFNGATKKGEAVNLTALAEHLLGGAITLPPEVPDLAIGNLAVSFDTGDKSFSFHGETAAPWTIDLGGTQVSMAASVDVVKTAAAPKPTVTLTGAWTIGSARFALSHVIGSNEITAAWDDLELQLSRANGTITLAFKQLPVGAALRRLVTLADPNFDFDLPPPWNKLDNFNLTGVALSINPTTKTLGFSFAANLDLGVVKLDSLSATFAKGKSVVLSVSISTPIPGVPSKLDWDMVNQPPPSVAPVKAPILDLRYIGLGQHISLTTLQSLTTVGAVMNALETTPAGQDPTTSLQGFKFDAAAGWFVGLDFTLLDTVSLSVIFDDPTVYGLLISLKGEKAKALAGLSFEILYRKIADNIGLYHIDLALPTAMRHLEFGEVSVTLPHIVLDVYTNGAFLVDFGFPYHRDFSQSLAIEAFPFTGAGGFYFGVLDSQTSTAVPAIKNGSFKPVIVFGIGLQVGVGKTIDEGCFSAGVLVAVEGILEGVLAFFQPSDASAKETYWALVGSVGVSAHVFGSIDFVIVQASVDLYVFANVQITAICHKPILLEMSAGVSVSLSVRICWFITVHVSFSTTVHESFTIGGESATPWILE
jgi:hypothetical protein